MNPVSKLSQLQTVYPAARQMGPLLGMSCCGLPSRQEGDAVRFQGDTLGSFGFQGPVEEDHPAGARQGPGLDGYTQTALQATWWWEADTADGWTSVQGVVSVYTHAWLCVPAFVMCVFNSVFTCVFVGLRNYGCWCSCL